MRLDFRAAATTTSRAAAAAGSFSKVEMKQAQQNGADSALIRIEHLHKYYYMGDMSVHALRGVNIDIARGSFVSIMGPSGSGKSTFMNIIGCLDKPTQGKYFLDGVDVSGLDRDELAEIRNQKIGFVFQQFNLLARTTALENVELPLLYSGDKDRSKYHERAMAALTAVNLADRSDHHPSQLSGGQQQRVAIARSLICNPRLILADEPTGALDSKTSVEIMGIFQRLNREQNMSVVIVTHEPDIAHFSDRIITFKDGHVLSDETVAEPRDAKIELENWQEDEYEDEEQPQQESMA
jgi:putative ABC transport system ATP-binding protein